MVFLGDFCGVVVADEAMFGRWLVCEVCGEYGLGLSFGREASSQKLDSGDRWVGSEGQ